jgi:hypothetical protein
MPPKQCFCSSEYKAQGIKTFFPFFLFMHLATVVSFVKLLKLFLFYGFRFWKLNFLYLVLQAKLDVVFKKKFPF